jgi:hypothetical protein
MLLGSPPAEISNLPRPVCERLMRSAWKRVGPCRWLMVAIVFLAAPVIVALDDSAPLGAYLPISPALAPWLSIAMVFSVIVTLVVFLFSTHLLFREGLRQQLLEEGIRPQGCLSCRMDFGDLEVRTCPWCGAVVSVAADERRCL